MRPWTLAVALAACTGPRPAEVPVRAAAPTGLVFDELALDPALIDAVDVRATSRATLDGTPLEIGFHTLRRVGDPGFGAIPTQAGGVLDETCNELDFNSFLEAHGKLWMVSHFECNPGAITITDLTQDPATGALTAGTTRPVRAPVIGGLWMPCAGVVSPWGTHLGSEEYEPDARQWRADGSFEEDRWGTWAQQLRWWVDPANASPYWYGWIPEVRVINADGDATVVKHFSMGRASHEIAYVLPDRRTAYLSDDGSDAVAFFMFVADEAEDLTAGTLYAARFATTSTEAGGAADVAWVSLGHARSADIEAVIRAGVRFEDLFRTAEVVDGTCPAGFTRIHAYGGGVECLALAEPSERVPDPATVASRLESRRYAALRGATTELVKGEGVTFDPATGTVFLAVSRVAKRMLAEPDEPEDHLAFPRNDCGIVLAGRTSAGAVDTDGAPIPSDHVIISAFTVAAGIPFERTCAEYGIANPDNIAALPGHEQLWIAEDTSAHDVNVLWSLDLRSGGLTRVLAVPRGGEVTGIHWIPDLRGWAYLTVTTQHPWGELRKGAPPMPTSLTDADKRSFSGYLGPFPKLTR